MRKEKKKNRECKRKRLITRKRKQTGSMPQFVKARAIETTYFQIYIKTFKKKRKKRRRRKRRRASVHREIYPNTISLQFASVFYLNSYFNAYCVIYFLREK